LGVPTETRHSQCRNQAVVNPQVYPGVSYDPSRDLTVD